MKKALIIFSLIHLQQISANWHTLYAHGIVSNPNQMQHFIEAISTKQKTAVQFCDAIPATDWDLNGCIYSLVSLILGKKVNREKMCMGQGADIETLYNAVEELPPDEKIILYGYSRGGAAVINYLAQHNPKNIAALVLDAAPSDIPASIAPTLAKCGINPKYALTVFCKIFPAYSKNSIPPVQAIKQIQNKNLPILMLHSKTDQKVVVQNAYKLYQEFKAQGFTNVHLVILSDGRHSFLLQHETAKSRYLQAIHTFYKKYNLPHNATWTWQSFDLDSHTPDMQEMQTSIHEYETEIVQTYRAATKRNTLVATITTTIVAVILMEKYCN